MLNSRTWMLLAAGVVAGAGFVGSAAWLSAAQNRPTPTAKVACVDIVRVFNEYERMKDLQEEMKGVLEQLDRGNQEKRRAIDALEATLNAMSLNDPTYGDKTRELLKMQVEYKNWFDLAQADRAREVGVWTRKIYVEVLDAVSRIAQSSGIDLVLYREDFTPTGFDPDQIRQQIRERKVIYANNAIDLSAIVLDDLNTKYRAQPKKPMIQMTVSGAGGPGAAVAGKQP